MPRKLAEGVYEVGVIDWDRKLFDELIPLPHGTSYNAYLITGSEKTALIDTVNTGRAAELIENIKSLGIDSIDYVIANHGEQDHSGSIPDVLEAFPMAKVVTNQKCKDILKALLHVSDERFFVVGDGEKLQLGDKTLTFILAPWVHWPETMLTYLEEQKILFPCDLFGSHLATSRLFVESRCEIEEHAKRYYAEIMMPFRSHIVSHLEKLKNFEIKMIAPSHGPIHQKPDIILELYKEWVSDVPANKVLVLYVSMHGSTRKAVQHFVNKLLSIGIQVKQIDLAHADLGEIAIQLVDSATVILATPTVLTGAHPVAVYAAYLLNALRPKTRFVGLIVSYGWGGRAIEQVKGLLTNIKPFLFEPVYIHGLPAEKDYEAIERLAEEVKRRHETEI
ncbi:MAG: FprA family A-type flavoprotein [Thermoplasmata archaeon]|nr:FprA family A-type flavoprotein [Thermoplasmata archaeon]